LGIKKQDLYVYINKLITYCTLEHGFHKRCGGIRRSRTPPNSLEFHRRFMSFHSYGNHNRTIAKNSIFTKRMPEFD